MNKSENIEGLNVGKGMLTDVLLENISDFSLLNKMDRDHLDAPEIYRASKFWQKLNRLNVEWLKSEGLENFKRSVNNNYFNWMVSIRSIYFRKVARDFFGAAIRRPGKLLQVFTVSISEMYHKTYVSSNTKTTYLQRKVYALYLLFLHEFVRQRDEFGMFAMLEEPEIGNPIVINLNGKRISQDISNSYMEYSYVRRSLGNNFSGIKTVAEIGGGYGRLSHLFHLFHHQDSVRIVLIDLPPALFVAQWYLRKTFPDAQIMGYRDFKKFSEIEREFNNSSICFLLPHQLELLPDDALDLLINISSLQEMSREQINHYYELVDCKARYFYTKQWVLWENPEDKISVPAVIYPTRPEWQLVNARLNPVHGEFFEAVFKVRSQ